jgi:hypothetical protein
MSKIASWSSEHIDEPKSLIRCQLSTGANSSGTLRVHFHALPPLDSAPFRFPIDPFDLLQLADQTLVRLPLHPFGPRQNRCDGSSSRAHRPELFL